MRKRMKKKKKSCGLCKPHKRAMGNRWKVKEEQRLKEFEKLRQENHEGEGGGRSCFAD